MSDDKQNATKTSDISADPRWGWSPVSRRYVLRTGATWKRLVKAGVVQDEEVATQLARPAQGTVRKPKTNCVTIQADRDAVANTISENFDASRLTGAQLAQIAAEVSRLQVASPKPRGRARKAGPPYRATTGVSHRRAPPPTSDDVTDEDEETETTATESACDGSQSDTSNARAVARDVAARLSTIRVSKPPARRR
jgi:hypothetical protein